MRWIIDVGKHFVMPGYFIEHFFAVTAISSVVTTRLLLSTSIAAVVTRNQKHRRYGNAIPAGSSCKVLNNVYGVNYCSKLATVTITSICHKLCGRLFTNISTANLRILWRHYLPTEVRYVLLL